ncbi:MAG TPA: hypothetical protein VGL71_05840, partial [Urbifossiella sp.]
MATMRFGATDSPASKFRGHMASRKGNASETPAPRRNARREMGACRKLMDRRLFGLENWALDDFFDQRAQASAFCLRLFGNRFDSGPVGKGNPRARGINDHFFGQRAQDLVRLLQKQLLEFLHVAEFAAIGQFTGAIDGKTELDVMRLAQGILD